MKVLSEKRMELSQTIASLIGSIRAEKGCRRCDFCQSMENENELCLLEEWDTQKNLKSYMKSVRFRILRGAMNLLQEPYEMMFHTVFLPAGMEGIYSIEQPYSKLSLQFFCRLRLFHGRVICAEKEKFIRRPQIATAAL
jgi:quinol monooxygenase YgiN